MKRETAMIAMAIFCLALPMAAQTSFSTNLTGAAETTVCDADGVGFAIVNIDGTTIEYALLVQNLGSVTGAHIHEAGAGVDGEVVVDLSPSFTGGNATGTVTADQSVINGILANPSNYYVNVHTTECADGAIRGQLAQGSQDVIFFPIVGSGPGQNQTRWITDLRVLNLEDAQVDVTLMFYVSSNTGLTGPTATTTIQIPAGRQMVLDNVIEEQLGLEAFGALELVANGDIRADARILNDRRGNAEGTAGFAIEGFELDEAGTAGALPLLSQGVDFRTNVGYFNPNDQSVQLTLTARSTVDGSVLGEVTVDVGPYEQVQGGIFSLVNTVPEGQRAQENFYVTWSSTDPIFVYGSVVDNITGDSVYID